MALTVSARDNPVMGVGGTSLELLNIIIDKASAELCNNPVMLTLEGP